MRGQWAGSIIITRCGLVAFRLALLRNLELPKGSFAGLKAFGTTLVQLRLPVAYMLAPKPLRDSRMRSHTPYGVRIPRT